MRAHRRSEKKASEKTERWNIRDWKLFPKSVMLNASEWVVKDEAREKITSKSEVALSLCRRVCPSHFQKSKKSLKHFNKKKNKK